MEDDEERYEVCLRCGEPNLEGTSRCTKCSAPLDPSAREHPWEMKTANHHASSDVTSPRSKPIVFWGVWLYFGPSAFLSIHFVYQRVCEYFQEPEFEFDGMVIMGLLFFSAYGILSSWALWSVTKGYFGKE